ncbi:MAG TPA: hypothetical protein VM555_10005 [Tahibacter sp.]|nr:hypothetical protein [Tahibacter sp.]
MPCASVVALRAYQVGREPNGTGGWICETETGGGSVQRNGHLDR